jgi:hypothetical protein
MCSARSKLAVYASLLITFFQLTCVTAPAVTEFSNEFWVSTSTNTANRGTLADPYNASTQPLFDKVMADMPPNCVVHLLAGTYQTLGTWQARSGGWPQVKSGQRIVGAGIDHTTIHLCRTGIGSYWFGTPGITCTNIEVSDLTIDGAGTTNCAGLFLHGDHVAVRRVKVVNLTSLKAEIFPICVIGGPGPSGGNIRGSEGNIIEGCELSLPNITWVSGISLGGTFTNYASGIIRDNRIFLGAYKPGLPLAAFNLGNDHDLLVEGNYVEGGNWGVYAEAGFTNLMIHHNTFKNVSEGVYLFLNGSTNVTCSFNTFELAPSPTTACAFHASPKYSFRNVVLIGNTIQIASTPPSGGSYAAWANGVRGLTFVNNMLDRRISVSADGATGVNIFHNVDLDGNPLPMNQEPSRAVARKTVTEPGVYLVQYADRYIGIKNAGLTQVLLPPAFGWAGKEFIIVREDGGDSFTLASRGGLINGTKGLAILKSDSSRVATTTVISDGQNWFAR